MFGTLTGTIFNAVFIIVGTAIGMIFKNPALKKIGERIFQGFGIFVIVMGINGAKDLSNTYLILASLIIGVAIGEIINLDKRLENLGAFFQRKFSKETDSTFSQGFVEASILFCVGSMAIIGALQSGIENDHTILITKGIMDGIASITMAMGMGIGVGLSALPILIYQGILSLCAVWISPVLSADIIAAVSTVGSLSLIAIGLNMLKITKIKVANFLPAMFMPIIYQCIILIFS